MSVHVRSAQLLMSSNVPPCPARSAPLSPPQSALGQEEEVTVEDMEEDIVDEEEDTVEDQDQVAMAPPGGRGGLLTLRVALGSLGYGGSGSGYGGSGGHGGNMSGVTLLK